MMQINEEEPEVKNWLVRWIDINCSIDLNKTMKSSPKRPIHLIDDLCVSSSKIVELIISIEEEFSFSFDESDLETSDLLEIDKLVNTVNLRRGFT